MIPFNRRQFFSGASGLAVTGASLALGASVSHAATPDIDKAMPTEFWDHISAGYDRNDSIVNLEHGYWTEMPISVRKAFEAHTMRINRDGSYYARRQWHDDKAGVEARLAGYLGCKPSEVALTRNASEALQALIGGYLPLGSGDAVLYADLDYGSVKQNFETLAQKRGARVIKIDLPEPATHDNVVAAYVQAMNDHPNIKYMVLTHVSNQTGLVVPVKEIIKVAKSRGVDVVVDAAHSWGQIDFDLKDLGADFVAFNLHKWIEAPLGVGFLYINEDRLTDIARNMSQGPSKTPKTSDRIYYGTMNFATVLTVHDALDYNDRVGWGRKAKRLKTMRDIWAEPARAIQGIEVLTPSDPRMSAGITSFRLTGQKTFEENEATVERLLSEFGIFTVARKAPAKGACIRVTPSLSNSPEDCDRLYNALRNILS
ncbi:aminotransferase class V-fold PLP-dependent enzyme [Litorimonas haliclonae]|uniref:aminotransferase class V-fold PLP-dependent enzyme n=1 Tax=Litorimonas haliclonae TaxID=2081977 RepID=UPI0039F13961